MNYVSRRLVTNDNGLRYVLSARFEGERMVSAWLTQIMDGCWTCVDFPCKQRKAVRVSLRVAYVLWDITSDCITRTTPETTQSTNEVSLANKA